ncbi:MAG: hypothetical protein GXY76_20980 [Chloroflexi bacterium]|nr:hypothetical protein [Chloroflexota bacterium]
MTVQYEDFTTKLMNDMDPALLDFVKEKVNTFIKWDLLRFFHGNPNTADTAENIARYVGRSAAAVKAEAQELVDDGLLQIRLVADLPIYTLTQDRENRTLIDQFLGACEDRDFRVKVVYHIIRGMR